MQWITRFIRDFVTRYHGADKNRMERDLLRLNLERARALPATLANISSSSHYGAVTMYEDGRIVDSMRVVVGRPRIRHQ